MSASRPLTGASSGLGEGMARLLADRGHNLALCARRSDRLEAIRDDLKDTHPATRVGVRQLDVTDHDAVFEVFRAFDDELGGIERVVVNAGTGRGASIGCPGVAVAADQLGHPGAPVARRTPPDVTPGGRAGQACRQDRT